MYGFLSRLNKNTSSTGHVSSFTFTTDRYGLMYTDKLERFKYWMALKGNLADEVRWRPPQSKPFSFGVRYVVSSRLNYTAFQKYNRQYIMKFRMLDS